MAKTSSASYEFITGKLSSIRDVYPSFRKKSDPLVFSALCIKSHFYKNPALNLSDDDLDSIVVDSQYDGGIDFMLTDPNTEDSDLILGQSKYYKDISEEEVLNALIKMSLFYKEMKSGHFDSYSEKVRRRFLTLDAETGEESKIHFVLYTSAPQNRIRKDRVEKKFRTQFVDASRIEVSILFAPDIEEEIKESESRRPTVESGKITIDEKNNVLAYGDSAIIVNVSAYSIKQLYAVHNTNLLSRNLRYHIAGREIDRAIEDTISNNPEAFWLRNNGITIICDDFDVDGTQVKLSNFSIVNGGQTTYMIFKSKHIDESNDVFLPCKIVQVQGDTEDDKNQFSLEIAKATNSQKPIKAVDMKANSPEQVRFTRAMREQNVFYQTKRGEKVPPNFKEPYLNTDLVEVGKLCLAAVFQMPCSSRNKPATLYKPEYYDVIFNGNQRQIASLCRELLYIDFHYRTASIKKLDKEYDSSIDATDDAIAFIHTARTICIAFVAFAARFYQGNITEQDMSVLSKASGRETIPDEVIKITGNLGNVQHLFPEEVFKDKDWYDRVIDELISLIIDNGIRTYSMAKRYDSSLSASNYLKKDSHYFDIITMNWRSMRDKVAEIFDECYSK